MSLDFACVCAYVQFWTFPTHHYWTDFLGRSLEICNVTVKNLFTQNMLLTAIKCSYFYPRPILYPELPNSQINQYLCKTGCCLEVVDPRRNVWLLCTWCVCKMDGNGRLYVLFSSQSFIFSFYCTHSLIHVYLFAYFLELTADAFICFTSIACVSWKES